MKRLIYKIPVIILLLLAGCKNPVEPEPVPINIDFYPLNSNMISVYNYDTLDVTGTAFRAGDKFVTYTEGTVILNTPYFAQKDSLIQSRDTQISTSFVRKTNAGVYYYVDTTGSALIIPDSLRNLVLVDVETIALSQPLFDLKYWSVYKILIANFSILSVNAGFQGVDTLDLTVNSVPVREAAAKIEYGLTILIPDFGSGETRVDLSGRVWYSAKYGVVKKEGNKGLFDFIQGLPLDLENADLRVRETLTGFIDRM
ncbi:MAG: hypothetical protein IAE91_10980 [Ignavibacteriaceae bacterium]|nr:hypothetical protein [Ignavibacteriaceae bacterium]